MTCPLSLSSRGITFRGATLLHHHCAATGQRNAGCPQPGGTLRVTGGTSIVSPALPQQSQQPRRAATLRLQLDDDGDDDTWESQRKSLLQTDGHRSSFGCSAFALAARVGLDVDAARYRKSNGALHASRRLRQSANHAARCLLLASLSVPASRCCSARWRCSLVRT